MHPPTRPEEPPKWNGLTDDDFDFLDKVSTDLAFLAQRVNHNKDKGNPGAGSLAAQNFAAIDAKRLDALAKADGTGQAQVLKDVYDEAKKSESNGWNDHILKAKWNSAAYDSSDPSKSMDTASWKFDRSKCPTDPHAAQRKAYNEWKDPSVERKDLIDAGKNLIKPASAKDKPDLDKAISQMEDAQKGMTDLENNIESVDAALASETDPDAKAALADLVDTIDSTYADLDKQFKDAEKTVRDWAAKQNYSLDSIADTIAAIKARGEKVNPLLDNWQKTINSKLADAKNELKQNFGLNDAQIKAAEGIWRKNCKALYDALERGEVTIATLIGGSSYVYNMLDGKHPVGRGLHSGYTATEEGSFGLDRNASGVKAGLCYCRMLGCRPEDYHDWSWGHVAVIPRPEKSVIAFFSDLYGSDATYGHVPGHAASLLTDASLTSATGKHMTKAALTQDLSHLKGPALLRAMGFAAGNEMHPIGGITPETCYAIKWTDGSRPKFTASQKAVIKKYGIKLFDAHGKEMDVNTL